MIQGDQYPTIGSVVPSIVGLHKCMSSMLTIAKHHGVLVRSLYDSLRSRFCGLFANLRMTTKLPQLKMTPNKTVTETHEPFSDKIYLISAAMDPKYGYIWLEADHPGTEDVKVELRNTVNSKLISEIIY